MIKKIILWIAVILLSVQIFRFSDATAAQSSGTSEKIAKTAAKVVSEVTKQDYNAIFDICHKVVRKSAHFTEYFLLAVLSTWLAKSYRLSFRFSGILSASYCFLYAISDEIHQTFIPGRSGAAFDVGVDFFGALCGICFFWLISKLLLKLKKCIIFKKVSYF